METSLVWFKIACIVLVLVEIPLLVYFTYDNAKMKQIGRKLTSDDYSKLIRLHRAGKISAGRLYEIITHGEMPADLDGEDSNADGKDRTRTDQVHSKCGPSNGDDVSEDQGNNGSGREYAKRWWP